MRSRELGSQEQLHLVPDISQAAAAVMFSTESFEQKDQFDAWCSWFHPVFNIARAEAEGNFIATNKIWNLNGLIVSHVEGPSVRASRTKANIAKAPVDHWAVSCCKSGLNPIKTNSVVLEAPPKVPYVWSLGERSESICFDEVRRIEFLLSRDIFEDLAPALDDWRGSVLNTPLGRVLGDYMIALERWLLSIEPEDHARLGNAVRSMIAACLAPTRDRLTQASPELNGFRAEKVRQAIRSHLKSPSLSPDALCQMVGISRSSLYRLFEHCGGIANYIQRQRLRRAYETLSDPSNEQSIRDISEELCFGDLSSFGRAFKHEFGFSPREARFAARDGSPVPRAVQPRQIEGISSFADLLFNT
ncbi:MULTISPECIES: helix-turn-helix domain-containing protein [unclassified Beijerinckia]|uniref:helix-turn-helix domain-containing protein n=1 Tax=unclassified Beijerinckia TaxID=2638183 RepID=UPI000896A047|nr:MULTISPECIES: helix-turn-helix domain-containing protein [unclassified Beijerinckia]MDH7798855.1 AraC-like DNA-binding protein [Beijerinckia sp. GAS462]SED88885.1 transcriptional regulator, AraC family [Beijerinckia sp. 28-YEA-48]